MVYWVLRIRPNTKSGKAEATLGPPPSSPLDLTRRSGCSPAEPYPPAKYFQCSMQMTTVHIVCDGRFQHDVADAVVERPAASGEITCSKPANRSNTGPLSSGAKVERPCSNIVTVSLLPASIANKTARKVAGGCDLCLHQTALGLEPVRFYNPEGA